MAGAYGLIEKVHAASALRTAFDGSALIYRVHILTVRPERLTRALARVCIIASIPLVLAHSVVSARVGHAGILLAGFRLAAVSTAVTRIARACEPKKTVFTHTVARTTTLRSISTVIDCILLFTVRATKACYTRARVRAEKIEAIPAIQAWLARGSTVAHGVLLLAMVAAVSRPTLAPARGKRTQKRVP